ncbi:MAG: response regulator [Candidatus Omnitrophica bacterium]|nr:response regulator [Candidatus Omnitrophota bacterium]
MNKKKTILIVDDEKNLRKLVGYQFKAKGYEVVDAVDGLDGLDKLQTANPDLIILDMNMPRMNGIEFYQKILDDNKRPKHPILVLTARANMEQLFRELDINGFMAKPFEIDELIEEAQIIIQKSDREYVSPGLRKLGEIKEIFIIENNQEDVKEIGSTFLGSGYKVSTANSGTSGIEKISVDLPALVLVNLSLVDIPGDMVVERLKRMSKTKDINIILYVKRTEKHNKAIMENMAKKASIIDFIEYSDPDELLEAVCRVYQNKKN